jgi:hypothetical protein
VEVERREALTLALKAILVTAILLWYLGTKEKTVYLMDFACFEPPADWKVTAEQILELLKATGSFTEDSLKFQERMMQQSGVGPSTAWPPGITQVFKGLPHNESAEMSRKEAEVSAVGGCSPNQVCGLSPPFCVLYVRVCVREGPSTAACVIHPHHHFSTALVATSCFVRAVVLFLPSHVLH